ADAGPDVLGAARRGRDRRALRHRRRGPARLALGPGAHARRAPGSLRSRLLALPQLHLSLRRAARLASRGGIRLDPRGPARRAPLPGASARLARVQPAGADRAHQPLVPARGAGAGLDTLAATQWA